MVWVAALIFAFFVGVSFQDPYVENFRHSVLPPSVEQPSPKPYDFGYEIVGANGTNQHRQESGDGSGAVKGSYGYLDALGIQRIVEYTADKDGYRAVVRTNEPGTGSGLNAANVQFVAEAPSKALFRQGHNYNSLRIVA